MLFLQMSKVFKEAGGQAPFYARTVVNGFVSGVHVSRSGHPSAERHGEVESANEE
jgi:hypothetical protein